MPYIWENYSLEKEYAVGERICPYLEIYTNNPEYAEVNPMLRFADLFAAVKDAESLGNIDVKKLENIIFHFLALLDQRKGFDLIQARMESLRGQIENGYFGANCQETWPKLNMADQEKLLYVLEKKLDCGYDDCFMAAINLAFPSASLCYERNWKKYYLYLGVKKTAYNERLLNIIIYLFWSIGRDLEIFWQYHYGIIDIDDTMRIGYIQIV